MIIMGYSNLSTLNMSNPMSCKERVEKDVITEEEKEETYRSNERNNMVIS